jgi:putative nucleotidyltransferase with HDIG domain
VRAPFDFPLYKDQQVYNREVAAARDSVLPVFVPTGVTATTVRDTLNSMIRRLDTAGLPSGVLSDKNEAWLQGLDQDQRTAQLQTIIGQLRTSLIPLFNTGIIDRSKGSMHSERIVVRKGTAYEDLRATSSLLDSLQVMQRLDAELARRGIEEEQYSVAIDILSTIWKPTLRFNAALTEEVEQMASEAVPRTRGLVKEGQIIVAPGEEITEKTSLMLSSLERSRRLRNEGESRWLKLFGAVGHVIILFGLPLIYLFNFRRRIYNDNLQIGIILVGIVLVGLLSWLSLSIVTPLPIEYLILLPFYSMLLAILFDSRTAFYLTVVAALIAAGIRGADYAVAIALLSAGVMAAYTVRDIKSRTQLYRSIAYSIFGFALAIVALGLERGATMNAMAVQLGFAGINAVVSPVLTFGSIFVLERVFNIATDLKLLEYDDLNHPLLRMLADKAPGTYQHTLTIARLAESAANAIGANALQAKVGSYFHDVGKIARAEYFVENQLSMANKHEKIKPEQSAKLIKEHVLDGIKLARQYGVPERIIDFIPTHHGTTTIKYFLDKAKEENEDVDESLFHYPGPLPHTRETAIVMLADSVEATARSLTEPDSKLIEEAVDRIIRRRFADGQLDECDLTLADLTRIREAFIKNLVGIVHPRVKYKDDPEKAESTESDATKREGDTGTRVNDAFSGLGVSPPDGGEGS